MAKPILKNNDLVLIIKDNINLLKELDRDIEIRFENNEVFNLISDYEQLSRVFLNLIKNSIESISEKKQIEPNFIGKMDIALNYNDDYIEFISIDNGKGFTDLDRNIKNILNPYFTTKKKGTGLGLAIVNKIINDHNGSINFVPIVDGAKIEVKFTK